MPQETVRIEHQLEPFIYPEAKVLLLGSMPSVQSLRHNFYYAHPQNRLWKIVAALTGRELTDQADKETAAKQLHLALFDVIASCERQGSMDSNIKNVVPQDLAALLRQYPGIRKILLNGRLAATLFFRYNQDIAGTIPCVALPSTSPANASWSLQRLTEVYARELMS